MIGKITRIMLSISLFILIAWATIAAIFGGPLDTISEHIRDYGSQYPLIAFAAGVLIGHWFWSQKPAVMREKGLRDK